MFEAPSDRDDVALSSAAALMADAEHMLPGLRERKAYGDCNCKLSPVTVGAFREAKFFQALQPAASGGLECQAVSVFRLQELLSRADMSAGWVVANMSCAAFHLALFPSTAQDDVWGCTPDAILASSNMPGGKLQRRGPDEFQLSGRWSFASGVDHADWIVVGASLEARGVIEAGACLVPCEQVEVRRDWDAMGLRGTGSHSVQIDGVTLPTHRFLRHADRFNGSNLDADGRGGLLYRLPLPQLLFRAISTSSLGGLRRLLEVFLEQNATRRSVTGQKISDDPHIQALCATVAADLQEMAGSMERDFEHFTRFAETRRPIPLDERRMARVRATRVAERCLMFASDLFRWSGMSALKRDSEIQSIFKDLMTARQHVANQFEPYARTGGAALFGLEREDMLL